MKSTVSKSESTSFRGVKSGAVSTQEPQLVLISEQPQSKSSFLSPVYYIGIWRVASLYHVLAFSQDK
ncbi:unnamed protein product [Coregonus sp. 'balchen']|nr:unnamed protein product [Coregonus sp. 'balchen']